MYSLASVLFISLAPELYLMKGESGFCCKSLVRRQLCCGWLCLLPFAQLSQLTQELLR